MTKTIITAEMIGARLYDLNKPSAERLFRRLPLYVKEQLTCQCFQQYNENLGPYQELVKWDGEKKLVNTGLSYCLTCLKPQRFSVRDVVQVCEECQKYYVPRPEELWPPRWRVCQSCGG